MAEKERKENLTKIIEFPKEVRVYGNISHVYFEGKDKFTSLIVEPNTASSSGAQPKKEKSTKEPILIVPVKQKNSEIHFVKVPLQKLSKFPKAKKLNNSFCPKVSMYNEGLKTEELVEYKTNLKEIYKKQSFNKINTDFDTCFVFKQNDSFHKNLFTGLDNCPITELFRFQDKPKLEKTKEKTSVNESQPDLQKKPSFREANTNTEENKRFRQFLVSPKKRKRGSK